MKGASQNIEKNKIVFFFGFQPPPTPPKEGSYSCCSPPSEGLGEVEIEEATK